MLLLEDDPAFARLLEIYLARQPWVEVTGVVDTIRGALRWTRAGDPDVVVADFHLPDGDGALAAALLGQLATPPLVLVISAYANPDEVTRALDAGAFAYLPKSRCTRELAGLLSSLPVGSRRGAGLPPAPRVLPGA